MRLRPAAARVAQHLPGMPGRAAALDGPRPAGAQVVVSALRLVLAHAAREALELGDGDLEEGAEEGVQEEDLMRAAGGGGDVRGEARGERCQVAVELLVLQG